MKSLTHDNIREELANAPIVLYGASNTGRLCAGAIRKAGLEVSYIVDDTETKWGQTIEDIEIISFEDFKEKFTSEVNVIISSTYAKVIYQKLSSLSNAQCFLMFDIIWPRSKSELQKRHDQFAPRIDEIKSMLGDEESLKVYQKYSEYLATVSAVHLFEIASTDECYFIPEVLAAINSKPLNILDAGAHDGDLVRPINKLGIKVEKWFCFEPDPENYDKLLENKQSLEIGPKMECVKKGLWDSNTIVKFKMEPGGTNSKVTDSDDADFSIDVVSIDSWFEGKKVDFIKMDIEGAEMNALEGGMKVIKANRPILAISIYHSIDDFFDIITLLYRNLDNYRFIVRHHAVTMSETVLYGIPKDFS